MTVRIVRLGSARSQNEGIRIGTVRRPPRGVKKSDYSSANWFDVWLPNLSPSTATIELGRHADSEAKWKAFLRKYRMEMLSPDNSRILDLLAALSLTTDFSVGCYCPDERRCHRSELRALLSERGAKME
jgi:uncharacterized protein YeaO (DUF488 family)